jgi:K+-transporting ATPase ATPase C chain
MLRAHLRPAIVLTALLCVLTGLIYPAAMTGLAELIFPHQAHGSLVRSGGSVVGSALIGQPFTRPEYFHPRPSAAGKGYDATASGGTNKGPTDRKLADTLIAGNVAQVIKEDSAKRGSIPSDMVTASGSGLDPDISPATAELQVARVARARGLSPDSVRAILRRRTEGRQFGLFGEPRVNVLLLNLALDSIAPGRNSR